MGIAEKIARAQGAVKDELHKAEVYERLISTGDSKRALLLLRSVAENLRQAVEDYDIFLESMQNIK